MGKVSLPLRTVNLTLRLSPAEKAKLERLARKRNVTLSYAMREGARMLLEDSFIAVRSHDAGGLEVE